MQGGGDGVVEQQVRRGRVDVLPVDGPVLVAEDVGVHTGRAAENLRAELGLLHELELHLPLDRVGHAQQPAPGLHLEPRGGGVPVEDAGLDRVAVVDLRRDGHGALRTQGVDGARGGRGGRGELRVADVRGLGALRD